MTGCVILFPIAVTFYLTWWFIHFVDGFFSPIYAHLGINVFGLGFVTSITFIFLVGVFTSSWLGASVLSLGEWLIKRMPFVRHIYNASKQISSAISPDQNTQAFKEVAIIRHPRIGEYAFGFITSSVILQNYAGDEELYCVYVPTNHLYIGDVFLINANDVIRPNLSVREGIGLGFVTSITFIFLVGVFTSSWLGASVLSLGEWLIKRMPFVRHIYNASKQISSAIYPDQNTQAFKEVAIIRHPRIGEYAFGFITSSVVLQNYAGDEELYCVYVPTNHLYIGDVFLINANDVIRPNLSVREGIKIVVSGGMSMPQILSTLDSRTIEVDRTRSVRS